MTPCKTNEANILCTARQSNISNNNFQIADTCTHCVPIFILVVDSFYFLCLNLRLVIVFLVFYFQFSFPAQSGPECRHQISSVTHAGLDLGTVLVHFIESITICYRQAKVKMCLTCTKHCVDLIRAKCPVHFHTLTLSHTFLLFF